MLDNVLSQLFQDWPYQIDFMCYHVKSTRGLQAVAVVMVKTPKPSTSSLDTGQVHGALCAVLPQI